MYHNLLVPPFDFKQKVLCLTTVLISSSCHYMPLSFLAYPHLPPVDCSTNPIYFHSTSQFFCFLYYILFRRPLSISHLVDHIKLELWQLSIIPPIQTVVLRTISPLPFCRFFEDCFYKIYVSVIYNISVLNRISGEKNCFSFKVKKEQKYKMTKSCDYRWSGFG